MKTPTLEQATAAIAALSGLGPAASAAAELVGIVTDLFDQPNDQDALKARYAQAMRDTDAALDELDSAIDARLPRD